jgi:choline dehydrogenase-like flavoprotein
MGNDPKTSVLNRYCQSHDVDNLFVTDGSCFVTSAGFNPALTIQTLSYWCANYIKKGWKGGAWHGGKA